MSINSVCIQTVVPVLAQLLAFFVFCATVQPTAYHIYDATWAAAAVLDSESHEYDALDFT